MNLYILRHAIAAERGLPEYEDDSQRPLTSKGEKKMGKIAEAMRALGLRFDLILSSPYLRAKQTAEIVARELDLEKALKYSDNLVPGADPAALISEIGEQHAGMDEILLVGHEPYLSSLISELIAGHSNVNIDLKKGGLCCLSVETLRYGQCAMLEWLLAPRQLTRLG